MTILYQLEQARARLADNRECRSGSFLYFLHEQDPFYRPAFWQLYRALIVLAAQTPSIRPAQVRENATCIYPAILMLVIHHLNAHDGSNIRDMPAERLGAYLSRLDWLMRPLMEETQREPPVPNFNDGLEPIDYI